MPIVTCPNCGKERQIYPNRMKRQGYTGLCFSCLCLSRRASKSPWYKAGQTYKCNGYILVRIYPQDFFYSMAQKNGYVLEHRLVMAKHLNRCLLRWEVVHHKGTKYPKGSRENRADNRIENLQLISSEKHRQITILENRIRELEKELSIIERQTMERIFEGTHKFVVAHKETLCDVGEWAKFQDAGVFVYFTKEQALKSRYLKGERRED